MQLTSWLSDVTNRWEQFRQTGSRKSLRGRRRPDRQPSLEQLETRDLLSVTAIVVQNELYITAGTNDSVSVKAGTGNPARVDVYGNNSKLPLGNFTANSIGTIRIEAGDGNNTIDLSGVTSTNFGTSLQIIITAGNGNDTFIGSPDFANSVLGGDGADTLTGGNKNDTLNGGNGNDSILGLNGDDLLKGTDGRDSIDGGTGNDSVEGGDGKDTLLGGAGNDSINGGADTDDVQGGLGNDNLTGGSGNDTVNGEDGNDTVLGGSEADSLLGGKGTDSLNGESGNDTVNGEDGDDTLDGGSNNNSLLGGNGNDVLIGGSLNDTAIGNDGDDSIYGGSGDDSLFGDSIDPLVVALGNDVIRGNAGNDTISGGGGRDTLDGDVGNDLIQSGDFDPTQVPIVRINNPANVIEGSVGQTTTVSFVVSLSIPSTKTVTVQYASANGSAVGGSDFTSAAGTVQFAPGVTSQTINVTVTGDGQLESDENFFIRLSNPANAIIGDSEGTTFILNDDGWQAVGPAPIQVGANNAFDGCIQAMVLHPTNPDIAYIGAVNGGIWRTDNATAASPHWVPQTDFLGSLSMGALEFDPTDPNSQTLVAGYSRLSSFAAVGTPELGMLRTTDGGATWTPIAPANLQNQSITSVAARGNVIMAASDNTWNFTGGSGLFRSTDTGATFQLISGSAGTGLPAGQVTDLVGDPGNRSRFYAAVRNSGIFRSDDSGATWVDVTGSINTIGRTTEKIEMAIHNSPQGNVVYVFTLDANAATGLFRSSNAGATWTALDTPNTGGQTALHCSIAADPTNPNLVYVDGVSPPQRIDATRAAGSQITSLAPQGHSDSREMAFSADGLLWDSGDGGIFHMANVATAASGNWLPAEGDMQITEIHGLAYDRTSRVLFAGTQDNGTSVQSAPGSRVWNFFSGGDGGDVAVDNITLAGANQSIRYFSSQNLGGIRRATYDASGALVPNSTVGLRLTVQNNGPAIAPQFRTPIELNAINPQRLIIGASNSTYESLDQGATCVEIGRGVGVNGSIEDPIAYGGTLNGVPNPDVLYVGSNNRVFVRTAAGGPLAATAAAFPGGSVGDIVLDPNNWNTAYVLGSNGLFVTNNAGASWSSLTGNLDLSNAFEVKYIPGATPALVVGNISGVFRMLISNPGAWTELGASSLPNANVFELEYDNTNDILYAATFGRGAWAFSGASLGEQINNPVAGQGGIVILSAAGDSMTGGDGNDTIVGSGGDDTLHGDLGDDSLLGGGGVDDITTGGGNDVTDGGDGEDTVTGTGSGSPTLGGGADSDTLIINPFATGTSSGGGAISTDGADKVLIQGTSGNDTFTLSQTGTSLRIATTRATITLAASVRSVTISGGAGNDVINMSDINRILPTAVTFDLGDGNDRFNGNNAKPQRVPLQVLGGNDNDTLTGTAGGDNLQGGDGNDSIVANDGDDTVKGGVGNDTLVAGKGNDSVLGEGGVDSITGDDGNDSLMGGDDNDIINGFAGNDLIKGEGGNDTLFAGIGNDRIEGGTGNDTIRGHEGNDLLLGGDGDDTLRGDAGDDTINGGDGNDTIDSGDGSDLVTGANGNDTIDGGNGNDTLIGGDGNDVITGGIGNDILTGDDGDDTLIGGGATDKIAGGDGTNNLTSNSASEIDEAFVINASLLALLNPI